MEPFFKRVTIIGVGLIGGSLALAIKAQGMAREVWGVERDLGVLKKAQSLRVIDRGETNLSLSVPDSDLVVIATPVGQALKVAIEVLPLMKAGCILTDVGSVKRDLVEGLAGKVPDDRHFVGGHPIAGTERSGVEAAFAALFEGANCILTPTPEASAYATEKLKKLWEGIGSKVIFMEPGHHDEVFAAVSHLPHMVAYSLVKTVADIDGGQGELFLFTGGGFRDFTRIASSHPEMWRDICLFNQDQILKALAHYRSSLEVLEQAIKARNGEQLYQFFLSAKEARDNGLNRQGKSSVRKVMEE
jgi:prephenate dehydrogenase